MTRFHNIIGEELSKVFCELEFWPTKLSSDYYGSYPGCEEKCLREVFSGRKAIYSVDCFADPESSECFAYFSSSSWAQK